MKNILFKWFVEISSIFAPLPHRTVILTEYILDDYFKTIDFELQCNELQNYGIACVIISHCLICEIHINNGIELISIFKKDSKEHFQIASKINHIICKMNLEYIINCIIKVKKMNDNSIYNCIECIKNNLPLIPYNVDVIYNDKLKLHLLLENKTKTFLNGNNGIVELHATRRKSFIIKKGDGVDNIDLNELIAVHYSGDLLGFTSTQLQVKYYPGNILYNINNTVIQILIHKLHNMHSNHIIHRDINEYNIIQNGFNCNFIDYGMSCIYPEYMTPISPAWECINLHRLAPECSRGGIDVGIDYYKVDVWALGTAIFLINNPHFKENGWYCKSLSACDNADDHVCIWDQSYIDSLDMDPILRKMLVINPDERMSSVELVNELRGTNVSI